MVPPVFLLGPLAGLLLVSRPSTTREWFWLLASGTLLALSLGQDGLADGFVRSTGIFVAGAFVALSLARLDGPFRRAVVATGLGTVTALGMASYLGAGWNRIEQALAGSLREAFLAQARMADAAGLGSSVREALDGMARNAGASAAFYPALLVLTAIAGCTLAWRWYHLLAARPVGPVGSRFREFRFSDQAIWLLVGALAVSLLPIRGISIFGAPLGDWAGNLLVVMVALYVARGLAVFVAASARSPGRIVAVLGVVALFLWPFAVGGLVLLGLADSWVDFRRRLESPPTGGLER